MTCTGDWATHHNACDCREAARAEELERLLTSNGSLRLRAVAAERERDAAEAEVATLRAELAKRDAALDLIRAHATERADEYPIAYSRIRKILEAQAEGFRASGGGGA